jgi:hypothetical protein
METIYTAKYRTNEGLQVTAQCRFGDEPGNNQVFIEPEGENETLIALSLTEAVALNRALERAVEGLSIFLRS